MATVSTPDDALDRSSLTPLWMQLEQRLRSRLHGGEFSARFPTDLELTMRYEVSRRTVREAIRHLNTDGLLRRERGRGTVVDHSEFEQRLGALCSLFQSIEAQGVEQTSVVLAIEMTTDGPAAAHLGLAEDVDLFRLYRVRYAGGSPLAVDEAWLPASMCGPLMDADFSHTALYDELESRCGRRPTRGSERITPVVPEPDVRELLELDEGSAAFLLERVGVDGDDIIEWRTTIIRGDRYHFIADWSASDRLAMRLAPMDGM